MTKGKRSSDKWSSYLAATGAFLAIGSVAQGQVVYTNENPDTLLSGNGPNAFYIDMDHDSIDDFRITQRIQIGYTFVTTTYGHIAYHTYTNNLIGILKENNPNLGIAASGSGTWALGFDGTTPITGTQNFNCPEREDNLGRNSTGYFQGAGDKYIGVKFLVNNTDVHYGWILVNVAPNSENITIKGYGYESQIGVGIHAGDTIGVYTDSLSVSNINAPTAIGHFFPSSEGVAFYVVQLHSDPIPTQEQIIAGTGANGATVPCSGNKHVVAGVADVFNFTGLASNTEYTFYLLIRDYLVVSSLVDSLTFNTVNIGIENAATNNLNVFPVPASNELNINCDFPGHLSIFNNLGQNVYREEILAGKSRIDISALPAGAYILQVQNNDRQLLTKFMKH